MLEKIKRNFEEILGETGIYSRKPYIDLRKGEGLTHPKLLPC